MSNYRNRKLLDLAHYLTECTNCGQYAPDGLQPAHENGIEAGKGFGIKSQDNRHAALCHDCHASYDQGKGTKEEKAELWNRAHKRTMDLYWKNGWLKVAA